MHDAVFTRAQDLDSLLAAQDATIASLTGQLDAMEASQEEVATLRSSVNDLLQRVEDLQAGKDRLRAELASQIEAPVPMVMWCPACAERHVDEGEFAARPHHTHACQHCGLVWRPAKACTVGVKFLPGYRGGE